jgi:hypothetical protein
VPMVDASAARQHLAATRRACSIGQQARLCEGGSPFSALYEAALRAPRGLSRCARGRAASRARFSSARRVRASALRSGAGSIGAPPRAAPRTIYTLCVESSPRAASGRRRAASRPMAENKVHPSEDAGPTPNDPETTEHAEVRERRRAGRGGRSAWSASRSRRARVAARAAALARPRVGGRFRPTGALGSRSRGGGPPSSSGRHARPSTEPFVA